MISWSVVLNSIAICACNGLDEAICLLIEIAQDVNARMDAFFYDVLLQSSLYDISVRKRGDRHNIGPDVSGARSSSL